MPSRRSSSLPSDDFTIQAVRQRTRLTDSQSGWSTLEKKPRVPNAALVFQIFRADVQWVEKRKIRPCSFIVAITSAGRSLSTPSPFSLSIDSPYFSTNAIRNTKTAHYNNSVKTLRNLTKLHKVGAQSWFYSTLIFGVRISRNAKVDRMDLERSWQKLGVGIKK